MISRNHRLLCLLAPLGALLLASMPAQAEIAVTFDMNSARLDYTLSSSNLTVRETAGSVFDVRKENTTALTILDTARIDGGSFFDLFLDLTMTDLPGANNWSAAGSLKFTDSTTTTFGVEAIFSSTGVYTLFGNNVLVIEGRLSPLSGSTILVNYGDPWTYVGQENIGLEGNQDGMNGQFSIDNPENYSQGDLVTLKFGLGGLSLDALFGANRMLAGGEVKGMIVPAPAAVVLGALGLGLVGWVRRKWAARAAA